jgi:GNAT superfamily N-acetyltransferase
MSTFHSMNHYEVRTMTRNELDFAIELAANEGWNPGLHDADCFYRTDPQGFFIGLLDGHPIGCISAVSYGGIFGFLGLYIVLPEYRGRGYGPQLWNRAIERLQGHNIGLDGVVEQQANYQKSGFQLAYRNIRYEGVGSNSRCHLSQIISLKNIPFEALCAYDRDFFPTSRNTFLQAWIEMPESTSIAYMENSRIQGYGSIRKCRRGYKIGPLFADTPEIADAIFSHLASEVKAGDPIFLDISEVNSLATDLVRRNQMKKVFETGRMYATEIPSIAIDRLFGITTFELG